MFFRITARIAKVVYLTRATLRLKEGDKTGAADDLNVVRTRSGLPNISSTDITELAIENGVSRNSPANMPIGSST